MVCNIFWLKLEAFTPPDICVVLTPNPLLVAFVSLCLRKRK